MRAINKHNANPKIWSVKMPNAPYSNRWQQMMKNLFQFIFIIFSLLCFIQCNKNDDLNNGVNISDDNFIQALIKRGYDLNNDNRPNGQNGCSKLL